MAFLDGLETDIRKTIENYIVSRPIAYKIRIGDTQEVTGLTVLDVSRHQPSISVTLEYTEIFSYARCLSGTLSSPKPIKTESGPDDDDAKDSVFSREASATDEDEDGEEPSENGDEEEIDVTPTLKEMCREYVEFSSARNDRRQFNLFKEINRPGRNTPDTCTVCGEELSDASESFRGIKMLATPCCIKNVCCACLRALTDAWSRNIRTSKSAHRRLCCCLCGDFLKRGDAEKFPELPAAYESGEPDDILTRQCAYIALFWLSTIKQSCTGRLQNARNVCRWLAKYAPLCRFLLALHRGLLPGLLSDEFLTHPHNLFTIVREVVSSKRAATSPSNRAAVADENIAPLTAAATSQTGSIAPTRYEFAASPTSTCEEKPFSPKRLCIAVDEDCAGSAEDGPPSEPASPS
jgi:hypothetical protein